MGMTMALGMLAWISCMRQGESGENGRRCGCSLVGYHGGTYSLEMVEVTTSAWRRGENGWLCYARKEMEGIFLVAGTVSSSEGRCLGSIGHGGG